MNGALYGPRGEKPWKTKKFGELWIGTGQPQQLGTLKWNTRSITMMSWSSILSRASESAVATTFKPFADTTRRSWASPSGASLGAAIYGSPSTYSAITSSQLKQSALWSFAMARLPTRHSTLPIRSSHLPGELSGSSTRRNETPLLVGYASNWKHTQHKHLKTVIF